MSERERQVMKKLKEVVDKQRDEIRAKDRELTLKNEDIEAVRPHWECLFWTFQPFPSLLSSHISHLAVTASTAYTCRYRSGRVKDPTPCRIHKLLFLLGSQSEIKKKNPCDLIFFALLFRKRVLKLSQSCHRWHQHPVVTVSNIVTRLFGSPNRCVA